MRKIQFIFFLIVAILGLFKNSYAQSKAIFLNESTHWADSIMSTLSEEERIAQLFMVAAYSNRGEEHKKAITNLVQQYKIGGVMFLQGGPLRQAKFTNHLQSYSTVPLLIAIDAEWGVAMRLDSCFRFPWQMTLGAINDTSLIYDMGVEVARQCKLLGIHVNFSPVVDVNSNPKNPIINNRSFGENPVKVGRMGVAYMLGMQDNNIIACAKHFPGHGDTDTDSHKTLPIIKHSRDRLERVEFMPFKKLINNGLGSIMVAHLSVPSLDKSKNLAATLSPVVVNGLLKKEMSFTGLVITDALNMSGVSKFYAPGKVDAKALIAGNDILLFSEDIPKAIEEIKKAILMKKISQKEIDSRCHKILMAKRWVGLNEYRPAELKKIQQKIITNDTKLLNKKLVKSSLTLLQNYQNLLPLKRLDTLQIAAISIGEESAKFKSMLSNYAHITHFSLPEKSTASDQAILLNSLSRYNLVIASVHKSNENAWKSYEIDRSADILLQSIALQSKVVLSVFANPYSVNSFLFTNNFDSFLLAYQNSEVAQKQAAQAIFGGISISGKIPVTTKHFDINTGIKTKTIRISYVTAEEIGFNTSMLYKIDSIINNAISQRAIPGCQVLIAEKGKIFFNKSYGYHTYEKKERVKNSDIYDLASITKISATVPMLMKMVDKKSLFLDEEIGEYLDLDTSNKSKLIIRDILAHQAKLQSWIPFYNATLDNDTVSGIKVLRDSLYSNKESEIYPFKVAQGLYLHYSYPDSIFQVILDSELNNNKKYRYSDLGYYLFHKLIQDSYNKKLDSLVDEYFYSGLGMENMGYFPQKRIDKQRIIPTEHDYLFRSQLIHGDVHDQGAAMLGGIGGHAGIFSNANDLAKLMQMYLNFGEYAEERYVSASTIKEFTKYQFAENGNRRGAGFDKKALLSHPGGPASANASIEGFGHTGFTGTLAWADPQNEIVYVFLSNRIHPDANNKKLLNMNVRTNIMQVIYNSLND